MATEHSYLSLISPGELGDRQVKVQLTVRQVAALQFILGLGVDDGLGLLAMAAIADRCGQPMADLLELEFDRAQARIGASVARALKRADYAEQAATRLAALDGRAMELGS